MPYTIEIDCPPGATRPDDLLPSVLKGTGVEVDDLTNVGRFFGNYTWAVNEEAEGRYEIARPIVKERLSDLYNSGACRYASW